LKNQGASLTENEIENLRTWIGRSRTAHEVLSPVPAACLAATLSLPDAGHPSNQLPPLWSWLYFPDLTPSDRLAADGSPSGNPLRPPVPLEQVMWAGAEFEFLGPLRVGVQTRKESTVADLTFKRGSRGEMVFVTWEHRFFQDEQCAVIERYRGVYLGASDGKAKVHPMPEAAYERQWLVNEAVLFRYSALTFNAHRIHYDSGYATAVGGYPALVVHGPLQATLLAETFRARYPDKVVRKLELRARAPLYLGGSVTVCEGWQNGNEYSLWTRTPEGGAAMECLVTTQ
jgi:3-methylfumaryl-CoA hydratase